MAAPARPIPPGAVSLDVRVDASSAIAVLRFGGKRLRYATVNAVNATAKRVQQAERQNVLRRFTVRKREFVLRQAAVISPFANVAQNRYHAVVGVGRKRRFFLGAFEAGAERQPQRALRGKSPGIAVPVPGAAARPSRGVTIPESLWVSRLSLRRRVARQGRRRAHSARGVLRGEQRTFLVPGQAILQRVGRGAVRALYVLARSVRLDRRLGFVAIARATVAQWWPREVAREVTAVFAFRGAGR